MTSSDYILYYFLKAGTRLFAFTPKFISLFFGRLMGAAAFFIIPKRKKITFYNLRYAFPQKSARWCLDTAFEVFKNCGVNLMLFLRFALNSRSCRVNVHGMQELKSNPRAVMLGCHLGNWEITGMETVARGIELYSIAKRIHTTAIDLLVNELRTVFGGGVLSDRGGVRAVLKKLKKNKRVYILFDQRINRGIPVKFFNRPVWGTHIVSILNRSTSAAVIPCYSEISKRGVDVFYEKPFDMLSEGDPLRADFINTQNQFLWLEDKIRSDPGSWYWVHNFWKPGKKGWKAVFLDRDGTINVDKGYVVKKKDLEFIPGVFEALRKLRKAGFLLVVVTNQSGIARGYYSQLDYRRFNDYFQEALFREGVIIDRVFHCPHHPDEGCLCRKPGTEMIERAAEELNINMEGSFMVGDKDSDISAGKKAGLRTVSLGDAIGPGTEADFNARTPLEAGEFILNQSRET